ncbi:type I-E CRISPR-associated protein Cse2/CasB [Nocardiopsis sp. CNT-189]|uniref:type I-E CRISPR-associated protein Cse2/CasB n=1 Tax=Nocardiopsis oceanisediminis TaxID=2816862 RepID=UPI003B2B9A27
MTSPTVWTDGHLNRAAEWRRECERRLQRELGELFTEGGEGKRAPSALREGAPATLNRWRKAFAGPPRSNPVLAMPIANILGDLGEGRQARRWEEAIHYGLGLFAVHQQSKDAPMHVPAERGQAGFSLGSACRELARRKAGELEKREYPPQLPQHESVNRGLVRRLDAAVGAGSTREAVQHVRGLIPLLKAEDIALDHGRLITALAESGDPARRGRVGYGWSRDFYRPLPAPARDGAASEDDDSKE